MEKFEFVCPRCSHVMRLPATLAGKKGKCPSCAEVVPIIAAKITLSADKPPAPTLEDPLPEESSIPTQPIQLSAEDLIPEEPSIPRQSIQATLPPPQQARIQATLPPPQQARIQATLPPPQQQPRGQGVGSVETSGPETAEEQWDGRPPAASHEMSDNLVRQFMGMLPPNSWPILGCQLTYGFDWLFIGFIPLWFNMKWTYVIVTDWCLAVCTRTLWKGCKEVVFFEYDSIDSISFNQTKKLLGKNYNVTITFFATEEPLVLETDEATYEFLAANVPVVKIVHANTAAFSEA